MNKLFGSVIPDQHDQLQQPPMGIEPEAKEATWVFVVEGNRDERPCSSFDPVILTDAVLPRGAANDQAA
ncbi:hypothetical protein SAMN04489806_2189 [Paramicrobacterium humi]|uniref:Uncharacterized protein n=1 Tax=Paramicrobacterium humi TaxID=640635 RepID=A0A1H4NGJ8_9MICO|nr:hypothetical protein SAMN04489806_2189 [Microbacterium humi]